VPHPGRARFWREQGGLARQRCRFCLDVSFSLEN
jgi:hypothetical protein